jgi:hypothetical protein
MARSRNRGKAVHVRMQGNGPSQIAKIIAGLCNRFANPGAYLELTLQKLWTEFANEILLACLYQRVRRMRQSIGLGVNKQVFLFNTNREGRSFRRHI